ncbi:MAG TPA: hypothetical protein VH107_04115 [Lacipirellulaceae bacterium]|jgi:hypothetical protein|nr:hypothetical protein [Lacipirellulaceae bacterium]
MSRSKRLQSVKRLLASRTLAELTTFVYRCAIFAVVCGLAIPSAMAQPLAAPAVAPTFIPTPIYWKQNLFLIPYQWSSAAQPAAAQQVILYVSKDHGATWQKISEAKPQVKAFNYRAEADGEYWFDVRTIDNLGHSSPFGPFQPELRVIVDTTIPRIEEFRAAPNEAGAIEIQCRATDANLDPTSLRLDVQLTATSIWQPIVLEPVATAASPPIFQGRWQPPAGAHPIALRATISDRAGNSAVYQVPLAATPPMLGPALSQPGVGAMNTNVPLSAPSTTSLRNSPQSAVPPAQSWPAQSVAGAPLQLWTSGKASADDGVTAYGNPSISKSPSVAPNTPASVAAASPPAQSRVPAQFADAVKTSDNGWTSLLNATPAGPSFAPLEPFRQPSADASRATAAGPSLLPLPLVAQPVAAAVPAITPVDSPPSPTHTPTSPPKLVGSRTFALEYDLDDTGRDGIARVELWGTRDGGQTWNRYTVDDDNRSPLVTTVDNEGLYGFKILVQSTGGPPINPPRAGDEPELWVSVDLHRPTVELTSIERGEGNLSDHLILHWRAQDNNLEARPIALFFSSRPTGPWSAVATNLENTGNYAWRVERYVPSRIYLRIEARDTAGNLAAFQTREPVEIDATHAGAKLRAPSAGPTAANSHGAIRQ